MPSCRTRSRSTSSSPSPTGVPAARRTSSTTRSAACATTTTRRLHADRRGHRRGPQAPRRRSAEAAAPSTRELAAGKGADLAIILYTSGTTGRPEGRDADLRQRHRRGRDRLRLRQARPRADEIIAYLPIAWVGDHIFSYAQAILAGLCVNCPESPETVVDDRREIGTTYAFAPPRVFENMLTLTMVRMEDASALEARDVQVLHRARRTRSARRSSTASRASRRGTGCSTALGDVLVYAPLQQPLRPHQASRSATRPARRSARRSSASTARSAST